MEKLTIKDLCDDLKAKRDALSLCHESLKANNDKWNGVIIVLSLFTGMVESVKIKLKLTNDFMALLPILMSSIIACISSLIKFKKYPEQMEVLIQSSSLLTNTLNKCRMHDVIDPEMKQEYTMALEKLETSLYPDLRRKFLKTSHKNLLCIMKAEQEYFNNIKKVNAGEKINIKCDSESDSSSTDNILIDIPRQDLEHGEKIELTNGLDISESPISKRKLPLIKEEIEQL